MWCSCQIRLHYLHAYHYLAFFIDDATSLAFCTTVGTADEK
jgi:hypothetical protein